MIDLKILCLNIHKGMGWNLKPTLSKLSEQLSKLNPDLIFFQEIRGNQAESLVKEWPHFSYGKNVAHAKGHYGNAILSKFPIIFSENFDLSAHRFERRGLLHSIIILSDSSRLHLLCVHLGLFKKGRQKQLEGIVAHIHLHIKPNEKIILAGDFNDWTSHATRHLVKGLGLEEAFLKLHGAYARSFPAWQPLFKLDRMYSRGFEILEATRLIENDWRNLSDHIGLCVSLKLEHS